MRKHVAVLTLAVSLFSCLSACSAIADPFDDAKAAYDRGDYDAAYRLFKPLAEQGHVQAQIDLGLLYYRGKGVPKNAAEAVKWFSKAAEQGDADAQTTLGYLYDTGFGGTQDRTQAIMWYRKAAEQGDPHGQYKLGEMYSRGDGVDLDYSQSLKWILKSADQGYAQALFALAVMYWGGILEVPIDHVEAYKWATLSASRGKGKAQEEALRFIEIIGETLTAEQISQAKELAREWQDRFEGLPPK